MSLSFSVSSGFVRPFMSVLNGACKLSDFVFLIPNEDSLEIISVHPSCTSHLLLTIDAIHLEGYRYQRLLHHPHEAHHRGGDADPRAKRDGGKDGEGRSGSGSREAESFAPASTYPSSASPSAVVIGASNQTDGDVLASATSQGDVSVGRSDRGALKQEPPHREEQVHAQQTGGEGQDVTLRLPTAALLATLLHQSVASIQSLHVRYISTEAAAAAITTSAASADPHDRLKPDMLCFDCMLTTGVVKSFQLHLVQGNPLRVAPVRLADYHLEVRGEPRLVGSLLASLPGTSASCMVVPMEGRMELRWWDGGGGLASGGGGGGSSRRSGARARQAPRHSGWNNSKGNANEFGADAGDGTGDGSEGSVAATVTALQTNFSTFQYFTANHRSPSGDGDSEQGAKAASAGGGSGGGPELVTPVDYVPLPGKIMDVKSFKLAAWLAGQLGQQLQLVMGDAGTPILFRTGSAAETFIVADAPPPPQARGGFVPVYQQPGPPNARGRFGASSGFPTAADGLGNDPVISVSFTMHVATSDVENPAESASNSSRARERVSGNTDAGRGSVQSAGMALSQPEPGRATVADGERGARPLAADSAAASTTPARPDELLSSPSRQQQRLSAEGSTHYGLSNATTLRMGATESCETPRSDTARQHPVPVARPADPFLTSLSTAATPAEADGPSSALPSSVADDTTQRSSAGAFSHVSASLSSGVQQHATPLDPLRQPLEGQTLVMIGATPRASAGSSVMVSQQQQQQREGENPSLPFSHAVIHSATSTPHQHRAGAEDVYIISPQQQHQQQQGQPFPFAVSPSSSGGGGDAVSHRRQRLSALYPLDYAAFATHAASSLRLDLTGTAGTAPGDDGDINMGTNEPRHNAHAQHGEGSPAQQLFTDGHEENGDASDLSEALDDVDDDLQQFLDSCSAMAMAPPP